MKKSVYITKIDENTKSSQRLNNTGIAGTAELDLVAGEVFAASASDASAVTLKLTTPVELGVKPENPDQKRIYPGQVYLCLARQKYSGLRFEIFTETSTYVLTSSSDFVYDCEKYDIMLCNINLEKGTVSHEDITGEVFDLDASLQCLAGGFETLLSEEGTSPEKPSASTVDRIPDFSRVGYRYGDAEIPSLPVAVTITEESVASVLAAGTYADTTAYIQAMIDQVGTSGGGAVYLRNGTYNVSRILFIDYDNTVVRGESQTGTIIKADGTSQRCVFALGKSRPFQGDETDVYKNVAGRWCKITTTVAAGPDGSSSFGEYHIDQLAPVPQVRTYYLSSPVAEDYVPVGRLYLDVLNSSIFSEGEEVLIQRPVSTDWISDIGMDKIAENGRTGSSATAQWNTSTAEMAWTRTIVSIEGNRLHLDAPIVQALDVKYGGGIVQKYSTPRISGSGVENLKISSYYDKNIYDFSFTDGITYYDEAHAWKGVKVYSAKDCWVRNVSGEYLGYSLVSVDGLALRTTVENCSNDNPVSVISGSRRYAFLIAGGELTLFRNCRCSKDRHAFIVNSTFNPGPNVFTDCTATEIYSVVGTHRNWGTGTLYDRIVATDTKGSSSEAGQIASQDRGNSGNGHGWTSANDVFWNPEVKTAVCFSPWSAANIPSLNFASEHSSGRNYAVGVIGVKDRGYDDILSKDYYGNPTTDYYRNVLGVDLRPDGEWYPEIEYGYAGTTHVSLPDAEAAAAFSWWPELSKDSYSQPLSLYECQKEDRHARGIYLNML